MAPPFRLTRSGDRVDVHARGKDVLTNPILNKGTAFPPAERTALGLDGLLPAHVSTIDQQLASDPRPTSTAQAATSSATWT